MGRRTLTACAVALVCLAGACGTDNDSASSDGGTRTTASTATSKEAFLSSGNAICKDMNAKNATLSAKYPGGPKSYEDLASLMTANADLIESSVQQLKALPQPPDDASRLTAMYAEVDQLAANARQMSTAASRSDQAAVKALDEPSQQLQKKVNADFTQYGLTECGK